MSTVEQDNTEAQTAPAVAEPRGEGTQIPLGETGTVAAEEKDDGRDYVILKRGTPASPNSVVQWEFVMNVAATSTEQAVRRAAETPGTSFLNTDGPTTLVAVPIRSFNPVSLQVHTTTRIVIS